MPWRGEQNGQRKGILATAAGPSEEAAGPRWETEKEPSAGAAARAAAGTCGAVELVGLAAGAGPTGRGGCRGGVWRAGPGMMNH